MDEAIELSRKLDGYNRKRQAIERAILSEIVDDIEKAGDPQKMNSLVFASTRWHPGVIGIVASRLVDLYCRPAILISLRDGIGKGSGRSIPDFNIYQGLKKCDSLLLSYGGHRYAAGISIREEDIEGFSRILDRIVGDDMKGADFTSQTIIDSCCQLSDISRNLVDQMERLAPYGSHNPEPVLCVRRVRAEDRTIVGKNHLRMRIVGDGASCNSIWFSKGHFIECLSGSTVDIVFTPQINYWNGSHDIQLKMKDMALPASS